MSKAHILYLAGDSVLIVAASAGLEMVLRYVIPSGSNGRGIGWSVFTGLIVAAIVVRRHIRNGDMEASLFPSPVQACVNFFGLIGVYAFVATFVFHKEVLMSGAVVAAAFYGVAGYLHAKRKFRTAQA